MQSNQSTCFSSIGASLVWHQSKTVKPVTARTAPERPHKTENCDPIQQGSTQRKPNTIPAAPGTHYARTHDVSRSILLMALRGSCAHPTRESMYDFTRTPYVRPLNSQDCSARIFQGATSATYMSTSTALPDLRTAASLRSSRLHWNITVSSLRVMENPVLLLQLNFLTFISGVPNGQPQA